MCRFKKTVTAEHTYNLNHIEHVRSNCSSYMSLLKSKGYQISAVEYIVLMSIIIIQRVK